MCVILFSKYTMQNFTQHNKEKNTQYYLINSDRRPNLIFRKKGSTRKNKFFLESATGAKTNN